MRRTACANGWLVDGDRRLHSRGVPWPNGCSHGSMTWVACRS